LSKIKKEAGVCYKAAKDSSFSPLIHKKKGKFLQIRQKHGPLFENLFLRLGNIQKFARSIFVFYSNK
jgi:hypothetical protein